MIKSAIPQITFINQRIIVVPGIHSSNQLVDRVIEQEEVDENNEKTVQSEIKAQARLPVLEPPAN